MSDTEREEFEKKFPIPVYGINKRPWIEWNDAVKEYIPLSSDFCMREEATKHNDLWGVWQAATSASDAKYRAELTTANDTVDALRLNLEAEIARWRNACDIINEQDNKIESLLKRIIADSQKQEPINFFQVIQEGMQLVPIEPTEKMIDAGVVYFKENWNDLFKSSDHYKAMLNASKEVV